MLFKHTRTGLGLSFTGNLTPTDDTIVALSTPPGPSGLGVVRLSGPDSVVLSGQLVSLASTRPLRSRHASVGSLVDENGKTVDQVVITHFVKPRSYTGEDVVEISCHGSPVILSFAVERAIVLGARLADPGEFTQRAFLNGRLDLAQAEAVRDLIEATTMYQARIAVQQLEGSLSRRIKPLKKQLCDLIALLEAGIDFAEDDIAIPDATELFRRLEPLMGGLTQMSDLSLIHI